LIYSDGTIRDTGHNSSGQLGRGDNSNKFSFEQAGTYTDWETLFSGSDSSSLCGFGLRNGGQLWGAGENNLGQLGKGDNTDINLFVQIGSDTDWVDVKTGGGHTVALKSSGTVWTTGQGTSGQLGLGDNANRNTFEQIAGEYKEIAAGGIYTLMIGTDNHLYGMGSNQFGQLGLPSSTTSVNTPTLLDSGEWLHVAASSSRGIALKTDGTIWFAGQIYVSFIESYVWTQKETDSDWVAVKGGGAFCVAMKSNGTAWSYGYNGNGQLGLGDTTSRSVFTQIGSDTDWESVLCGATHCIAKKGGLVYRLGANNVGQLGTGDATQQTSPLLLS
jgi:alpha-tubulin suppressor-like RCC1 family protein